MDFIEERRRLKRLRKPKGSPGGATARKAKGKANPWQYTNTSYRPDLDLTVRSNWEANFARVLNMHGIEWEFEPQTFQFPVKKGTTAYVPDFYLPATNEYVEIKGYLDSKSKTKLRRFRKYYPEEWSNFVFLISRSSTEARLFAEQTQIPTVIFYEDLRDDFKEVLGKFWQGK